MKIIRIPGFAILILLILLLWVVSYFFVNHWVASGVEQAGGQANGATVSLDRATIGWLNGGLSIDNLAAADPANLSKNRFALGQLDFDLSLLALLKGQLHADKLVIRNLSIQSDRSKPAKVIERVSAEDLADWEYPKSVVNDVQDIEPSDILAQVDIKSPAMYEAFANELDSTRAAWNKSRAELPTKEDLARHKKNYQASKQELKKAKGLQKIVAAKQLKKVIADVKKDRSKLNSFKQQVKNDLGRLKRQWTSVQQQVAKDAELAMSMASLSPDGLKHVAAKLLGEDMASWLELIVSNLEMFQGALDSNASVEQTTENKPALRRGTDYSFDGQPLPPDLWIKQAEISGDLSYQDKTGTVLGTVDNLADKLIPAHPITAAVSFTLPEQDGGAAATGNIEAFIRHPESSENPLSGNVHLDNWPLDNWSIADESIQLVGVKLSMVLDFAASEKRTFVSAKVQLSQFDVVTDTKGGSEISKHLAEAIKTTPEIKFEFQYKQEAGESSLDLSSDLDERLFSLVNAKITEKVKVAKQKVETQIEVQVAERAKAIEEQLGGLLNFESLLSGEIAQLGKYQ